NHYSTYKIYLTNNVLEQRYSIMDLGVGSYPNSSNFSSTMNWFQPVPSGLRKVLNWIKTHYGNTPVLISENGYEDHGEIFDFDRIKYLKSFLNETLKAIHEDGCNVVGYTFWSLMDTFEWRFGYK